ncbi:periplasmic heavy metal sensor [Haloferula sp. A504]|uniref:periplasmic heavy metal sensor n=1 Tax=Haloferula sp. A504 TaxID=3373601 RepID=UPI0031BD8936|nr:periplasmic heavy metal sensor [Verrucomicrobiaceae bacterium E54]
MKRATAVFLWALATVLLAAGTSLVVLHWFHPQDDPEADFHQWMHQHLVLSPAQQEALESAESRFAARQEVLLGEIAEAERALAAAIRSDDADSPAIAEALEQLHKAQGELQHLTLDHFFEMKEQLDPEQAEKLRQWTHDRLLHP